MTIKNSLPIIMFTAFTLGAEVRYEEARENILERIGQSPLESLKTGPENSQVPDNGTVRIVDPGIYSVKFTGSKNPTKSPDKNLEIQEMESIFQVFSAGEDESQNKLKKLFRDGVYGEGFTFAETLSREIHDFDEQRYKGLRIDDEFMNKLLLLFVKESKSRASNATGFRTWFGNPGSLNGDDLRKILAIVIENRSKNSVELVSQFDSQELDYLVKELNKITRSIDRIELNNNNVEYFVLKKRGPVGRIMKRLRALGY